VNKNVCCTIVGAGPDEEWLLKKLINSEYNNRIKYLGRVRPDCIGEVIKEFGIQLLMSDYEGLPVSMLECMSVGIIPATRNIKSGINELIEDGINGIVLPDNPVNAAEKLNLLIQDDNFLNSASNKCIDISKEFSQEKNIEKWLEVIAQHSAEKPVEINLPKRLIMPKFDKRLQGRYKQKPNLFQILSNKLFKQRL
jgi:glycosyltransferase involved in cell wall biosynthesis